MLRGELPNSFSKRTHNLMEIHYCLKTDFPPKLSLLQFRDECTEPIKEIEVSKMRNILLAAGLFVSLSAFVDKANAQQILCIKNQLTVGQNGKIPHTTALRVSNSSSCPKGFRPIINTSAFKGDTGTQGIQGEAGPQGTAGTNGAAGTTGTAGTNGAAGATGTAGTNGAAGANGLDGAIRVYGDGSAGDLTVAASAAIHTLATNLQFENVVIDSGQTLTVPSGTTIRCTGTFTNNGTITVETGAVGGFFNTNNYDASATISARQPSRGLAISAGLNAQIGDDNVALLRLGGAGGGGLSAGLTDRLIRSDSWEAGSGGGASFSRFGGGGGGFLRVLCREGIVNNGAISADGADSTNGGGGGGGGIVLLASQQSVQNANSGSISVQGGDGGSANTASSSGGGAGGGILFLLAPTVSNTGSVVVSGGVAGASGVVTANPRSGGGGGGSMYGGGGTGGIVDNSFGTAAGAGPGNNGITITIQAEPTATLL